MTKPGRPGIPYEAFVETWEQLLQIGRATTKTNATREAFFNINLIKNGHLS